MTQNKIQQIMLEVREVIKNPLFYLLFGYVAAFGLTVKGPTKELPNSHVRYYFEQEEDKARVYFPGYASHKLFVDEGNDGTLDRVTTFLPGRGPTACYYDEPISNSHQNLYERIITHERGG